MQPRDATRGSDEHDGVIVNKLVRQLHGELKLVHHHRLGV
jgi:hypothetical protein